MGTVNIKVTINGALVEYEVSEAAYDLFLSAAEIGIEGASDWENDAHAEDASELYSELRTHFGNPRSEAYTKYEETGDERLRTVM